jgi:SlyX protein
MSDALEHRVIELETRLTHQERLCEDLSDVIAAQARTIDALTAQVRMLRDRVSDLAAAAPRSPQDERPPPHY